MFIASKTRVWSHIDEKRIEETKMKSPTKKNHRIQMVPSSNPARARRLNHPVFQQNRPVSDSRRINKRPNTSWSPNSVLSVGTSTKRFDQQVHRNCKRRGDQCFKVASCDFKDRPRPASQVLAVRFHRTWRNHGRDDSQLHSRRRNARLASFRAAIFGPQCGPESKCGAILQRLINAAKICGCKTAFQAQAPDIL
jgi:hypothetical protein